MSFSHTQKYFFSFVVQCIFLLYFQPKFTETTLIYFEDYIMNQFLLVCGKLIKKNIVLAWNNKNRFMILLLYIWHIFSNFIYLKAISSTKNSETTHYGPRPRKNRFESIWKLRPFLNWPAWLVDYLEYSHNCAELRGPSKTSKNMLKLGFLTNFQIF